MDIASRLRARWALLETSREVERLVFLAAQDSESDETAFEVIRRTRWRVRAAEVRDSREAANIAREELIRALKALHAVTDVGVLSHELIRRTLTELPDQPRRRGWRRYAGPIVPRDASTSPRPAFRTSASFWFADLTGSQRAIRLAGTRPTGTAIFTRSRA